MSSKPSIDWVVWHQDKPKKTKTTVSKQQTFPIRSHRENQNVIFPVFLLSVIWSASPSVALCRGQVTTPCTSACTFPRATTGGDATDASPATRTSGSEPSTARRDTSRTGRPPMKPSRTSSNHSVSSDEVHEGKHHICNFWNQPGDVQQQPVHRSSRDVSAPAVKDVVIQWERGRAGWGRQLRKQKQNHQKTTLNRINRPRRMGKCRILIWKWHRDWLKVCQVNTREGGRGILSATSMINSGLCGICEEGFSEDIKKTSRLREKKVAKQHKPLKSQDVSRAGGGYCCSRWAWHSLVPSSGFVPDDDGGWNFLIRKTSNYEAFKVHDAKRWQKTWQTVAEWLLVGQSAANEWIEEEKQHIRLQTQHCIHYCTTAPFVKSG